MSGPASAPPAAVPDRLEAVDHAPGLERALLRVPEERSYRLRRIEGEVPAWLRGTVYLNGPGRFVRGDLRYRHWLDGDGMVGALRFDAEGVSIVNRFVRSAKWCAEEAAGRALFRTFGTAFPGDQMARGIALESPINVSVVPFAGSVLAFGEQGLPWALDPQTLETRGRFDFGGGLNALSPLGAHPKIDPASGEMWSFGVSYARQDARLNLYRFDGAGALLARRRLPLEHPCSLHDFCLSPNHAVFHLGPYLLDMAALAEGGKPPMEALRWRPELGSRLLVVRRDSGLAVAAPAIGHRYCLHTINAWEEDGRLTVDLLELDRPVYDDYQVVPELFTAVGEGCPVRLVVDLASGELVERREIGYRAAPDFPAIDPERLGQRIDSFWLLGIAATGRPGRKFFDQLLRLDWRDPHGRDLWQAPAGAYLGCEPVFVAAPGAAAGGGARAGKGGSPEIPEVDGVVICHQYDARRDESAFLLFSAFDVAAGPFSVLRLESPLHLAFHAVFHPH